MKVFTLTLVALLIIGISEAAKSRHGEKPVTLNDFNPLKTGKANETEITAIDIDKKDKELHKRGIFHYGGASAAPANLWPKNYAAHYGYGLHLPAASGFSVAPLLGSHLHSPTVLKYNNGFHYKTLAAPSGLAGVSGLPAVSGLGATLPSLTSLRPALSHAHLAPAAQPYIIRPGGAVVQSYSVTYPHRKAAVKPIRTFASAVRPHLQSLQPVAAVHPAVAGLQPAHTFQPVHHVQSVQPLQPVAAVPPVHHLQPVQPVQHFHPVQPVQTVVQVQQFKPPVQYDVTQQFPSFFQPSYIPTAPVPAIPQAPTVSFSPAQPAFPTHPTLPTIPTIPSVPDVPAVPTIPNIPTIPSIPNFPQPQVPTNGIFPAGVQPPFKQKPPAFGNVNPQAHFPGFGPTTGNNPDFGSADASPQIPAQPLPSPEPEFPSFQPEANDQPWKPVLYEPPTVPSPVSRPSHTLLPPYGSSPAEGYLPPADSSNSARLQQEYSIDSSLFDNLSDADIQQIFAQANLAAQRDHLQHHHTVHNYHTRY